MGMRVGSGAAQWREASAFLAQVKGKPLAPSQKAAADQIAATLDPEQRAQFIELLQAGAPRLGATTAPNGADMGAYASAGAGFTLGDLPPTPRAEVDRVFADIRASIAARGDTMMTLHESDLHLKAGLALLSSSTDPAADRQHLADQLGTLRMPLNDTLRKGAGARTALLELRPPGDSPERRAMSEALTAFIASGGQQLVPAAVELALFTKSDQPLADLKWVTQTLAPFEQSPVGAHRARARQNALDAGAAS